MCTVLAILAKGDQNCAGNDITGELFENQQPKTTLDTTTTIPTTQPVNPTGKVMEEKLHIQTRPTGSTDINNGKADNADEGNNATETPTSTHKFINKFKAFVKKMTEPDEEEK